MQNGFQTRENLTKLNNDIKNFMIENYDILQYKTDWEIED
tara:strand:- start:2807 stop:2926 length:120 start_codon:yes stop_codon:yes gene_type:complete